ncbi:uncharacterized protein LOC130180343 [Seriola aureovittata]|uniref:uncharacterized protein LOC130180343 n=1 Tax=Seriola aureovittata TaxID=2871759 RepID=UPI0024BDE446|nr:uncharacterized protein LOC130180343 [Seriola aureovittata]
MTASPLIISIITLIWIGGVYLSKEKQVFQTPAELLGSPNSVVNLSLTHHISSYDTILWYQRSVGSSSLKLIGYMNYKNPKVEKEFEGHFDVSGDGEKTAFLHILNLTHPEDSGEYFGAAIKMIPDITTLTFFVLWAAGVSQSVLITQWPRYISRLPDGSAEMHCYQNDTDYEYLYWYRQLRGKDIQLVVYLVAGSATFEEEFKSGFQAVTLTEKQWSLTISSVQEKDEAVYLCAASLHSAVADL